MDVRTFVMHKQRPGGLDSLCGLSPDEGMSVPHQVPNYHNNTTLNELLDIIETCNINDVLIARTYCMLYVLALKNST